MHTKRIPRSRPETVERRKDILRAALEIFGAKGYKRGLSPRSPSKWA